MNEFLHFIRNLLLPSTNRKRAALDIIESTNPKQRRLADNNPEDEWISVKRLKSQLNMERRYPLKSNVVIIDDEDDDVQFKSALKLGCNAKKHISSTPNGISPKESIDLTLDNSTAFRGRPSTRNISTSTTKFENFFSGRDKSVDTSIYITPKSQTSGMNVSTNSNRSSFSNGTRNTIDLTYRLDEKQKYQELLNKTNFTASGSAGDSFLNYYTPLNNKMSVGRGRKSLGADMKKSPITVDLTNGFCEPKRKLGQKTATSETILKVLDDMESDVIVIKDNSDSDVELLPTPPSPEPAFKITPINSLKQKFESCEYLNKNWDDRFSKHEEKMRQYSAEIQTRDIYLAKMRQINQDIIKEQLDEQVRRCLHIKDVVIPIEDEVAFPALTDKQEQMIAMALDRRQSGDQVLARKFNLNITRRDMLTLAGLNWLNDEVINFYMNLIIERSKLDKHPNVYAFNTFFYSKMLKGGQQSVRRWTRKVDIFAQDLLCVPIHLSMHWCMAVIDLRSKTIQYYDSMGKANHQCTEALFKYLQDEHVDKKEAAFDTNGWSLQCPKDIPQQMNGSDCGMFACTFAEFQSRKAAFSFQQEDMPYLRRKMVLEIIRGELMIK